MTSSTLISHLLLVVTAWLAYGVEAETPRVTLPHSSTVVSGITLDYEETEYLRVSTTFQAYLGIPYAEPPVGDLRFEKPVKKGDLGNTYLAVSDRAICPQLSPVDDLLPIPIFRNVDEDCLYLNVHTPSPRPTGAPVLVWFHGGMYTVGAGSSFVYEPVPLMAFTEDFIVVTVNYRLGVFGFLTTGDTTAPGNYGMFDQVMSLQWVQDNIEAFGGDPSRVTIMGQSAGSASVGLHVLSPQSSGLFQQAIMESGNALCPWAVDTNIDRQIALSDEIAKQVGCYSADSEDLISCLRTVDEPTLTRAQIIISAQYLLNEMLFTPVVDFDFLPDLPINIVQRSEFNSVPTLLGTNQDEGTFAVMRAFPTYVVRKEPPPMSFSQFQEMFPQYLYYSSPTLTEVAEQWYVDWTKADDPSADHLDAFIDMNTDQTFACATEAMARALSQSGAPTFRYEMTHDPAWSIIAGIPTWIGAGHGEELQYVFGWAFNDLFGRFVGQTEEEKTMSLQFMTYWTNFIRTGDPNSAESSYPPWPTFNVPELKYKQLSVGMENSRALRMDNCALWLNLAPDLYAQDMQYNNQ
ncbi:acetylcholinesterase-like [Diadema antillarum]|uniref:acetylcholinesterase-like n=1 Tax=Diadema antillarum TaxID=105358 RepID=UPI003A8C1BC3